MTTISDTLPPSDTDLAEESATHSTHDEVSTLPGVNDHGQSGSQPDNQQHCENQHESLHESEAKGEEEEEEEEGECGFCLFMKSGPCRTNFVEWEECVEGAEKAKEDIVTKCHQVTLLLKECMENNADYYDPVLRAEKEMTDAAIEEAAALQDGSESKKITSEAESHPSTEQITSEAESHPSTEQQVKNLEISEGERSVRPENSEAATRPSSQDN